MAQNFANVLNEDESTVGSPTIIIAPTGPSVSTWAQILSNGNLSGANDAIITGAQQLQFQDQVVRVGTTTVISATGNAGAVGIGLNTAIGANSNGAIAIGRNSAIGTGATNAIAIGNGTSINNSSTAAILIGNGLVIPVGAAVGGFVAIGNQTTLGNTSGIVSIGNQGTASGNNSIKMGSVASVSVNNSIAIGASSTVNSGSAHTLVGDSASITSGSRNVVMGAGSSCSVSASQSISIGDRTSNQAATSIVIGNQSSLPSTATSSIRIGGAAVTSGAQMVSIGNGQNLTNADNSVALGTNAIINSAINAVSIGLNATVNSNSGVSIGSSSSIGTTSVDCISIGRAATNGNNTANSISIGVTTNTTQSNSVSIGNGATTAFARSVSLGFTATATADDQIRLGIGTTTVSVPGFLDECRSQGFRDPTNNTRVLEFSGAVGAVDYLNMLSGTGTVTLRTDPSSASANVDLALTPKGTGDINMNVSGTRRAYSSGYLQAAVVDSGGVFRTASQIIPAGAGVVTRIIMPSSAWSDSYSGIVYNDTANNRCNLGTSRVYLVSACARVQSVSSVANAAMVDFCITYFNGAITNYIAFDSVTIPATNNVDVGSINITAIVKTTGTAGQWVALECFNNPSTSTLSVTLGTINVVLMS